MADLDLEAMFRDATIMLVGDPATCRLPDHVRALVAEVRRLREDRDRWRSNRRNAEAVVEEVGDELGEMRKERDRLRAELAEVRATHQPCAFGPDECSMCAVLDREVPDDGS